MRHIALAAVAAGVAAATAACSSDDPAPTGPTAPATATVEAGATTNTFTAPLVTIARGGTVTWTFGARAHNVVFDAAAGAPENIGGPGQTPPGRTNTQESRTFNTAGTFPYNCTFHSGMNGTVVVK